MLQSRRFESSGHFQSPLRAASSTRLCLGSPDGAEERVLIPSHLFPLPVRMSRTWWNFRIQPAVGEENLLSSSSDSMCDAVCVSHSVSRLVGAVGVSRHLSRCVLRWNMSYCLRGVRLGESQRRQPAGWFSLLTGENM